MLSSLLGSKNAERILLFLLVNESCYTSEVQKNFGIALSPIQNIMQKFEKAGIIYFEMQGKVKVYRLNPGYPLYNELKILLKTAFIHLPSEEKRTLFSHRIGWKASSLDHFKHKKRVAGCLAAFWQLLEKVKEVSIETQSTGKAFGKVSVQKEKGGTLLFKESGQWEQQTSQGIDFSKTLRWQIDYSSGMISLEHLHYGDKRPVFLFHLAPTGTNSLQSIDSHLCLNDCYFGRISFTENHIQFLWRILGPRKNEVLYHTYTI